MRSSEVSGSGDATWGPSCSSCCSRAPQTATWHLRVAPSRVRFASSRGTSGAATVARARRRCDRPRAAGDHVVCEGIDPVQPLPALQVKARPSSASTRVSSTTRGRAATGRRSCRPGRSAPPSSRGAVRERGSSVRAGGLRSAGARAGRGPRQVSPSGSSASAQWAPRHVSLVRPGPPGALHGAYGVPSGGPRHREAARCRTRTVHAGASDAVATTTVSRCGGPDLVVETAGTSGAVELPDRLGRPGGRVEESAISGAGRDTGAPDQTGSSGDMDLVGGAA